MSCHAIMHTHPASHYRYGSSSRCFMSSLLKQGYVNNLQGKFSTQCLEQRCTADGTLEIKVNGGGGGWTTCPRAGGEQVVAGFMNSIRCPPSSERCTESAGLTCPGSGTCSGHGTCGAGGKCACDDGFSGTACEATDCPDDCSGKGVCNTATGACACANNFVGASCATCSSGHHLKFSESGARICEAQGNECPSASADAECSGHGTCGVSDGGACDCGASGYSGADCAHKLCPSGGSGLECSDHGLCHPTSGVCTCSMHWTGEDCAAAVDTPKACERDCSGHGTCNAQTGACACESGFTGSGCAVAVVHTSDFTTLSSGQGVSFAVNNKAYAYVCVWGG